MQKIEKELTSKLKMKPDKDEDRQEYLTRLARTAEALEDTEWDKLSAPTQDWVNDAIKAFKAKKALPDFDAGDADEDDTKPAKAAKAKGGGDKKAKGEGGEKGVSSMMFIRHYLVQNPDASVPECAQAVAKAGYKAPSTVTISTVRSEFRSVVRILKEQGYFKTGVNVGSF